MTSRRVMILLILAMLAACTPKPTGPVSYKLTEVARLDLPVNSRFSSDNPLSPDGRWVSLLSQLPDNGFQITLYPADGGSGRNIASITGAAVKAGTLQLTDIGWTKNGRFVYSREGTQPDGPHKGQRGFSLMAVTLGKDSAVAAEAAFIPVPAGSYVTLTEMPGRDTVLVVVGDVIWSVNLEGANPAIRQRKLPGPEAAYYPALSPSGQEVAYYSGTRQPGIHVLNLSTGADINAVPQGESMSYYPKWSPDGKHFAVYSAARLSGTGANAKYDYIPGEDGPFPVGNRIDIVTPDGKKVASLQVQGLKVADFRWSANSQYILFASVKQKGNTSVEGGASVEWQSLYSADLTGKTLKLGDFPSGIVGGEIVGESSDAKSAYAITYSGQQGDSALYSCTAGQPPARLAMPAGGKFWLGYSYKSLGEGGLIMYEADRLRGIVQLPSLAAVSKDGQAYLGNTAAKRFVYTYEQQGKKPQLVVMSWN